jgi:hypothetical protein
MHDIVIVNISGVGDPVVRSILSFRNLESGWHFGQGKPATSSAIGIALELQRTLREMGAEQIEAFPRIDGGIVVSSIKGGDVVDVTCNPDGSLGLYIERNDAELVDLDSTDRYTLHSLVRFLNWREKAQSGYFIRSTTRTQRGASIALSFNRPETAYPSSTTIVPNDAQERYVSTFLTITTKKYPGTHQSSTGSNYQTFQSTF